MNYPVNVLQFLNIFTNLEWLIAGSLQVRSVQMKGMNGLAEDGSANFYTTAEMLGWLTIMDGASDEIVRARQGLITTRSSFTGTGFTTNSTQRIRSSYVSIDPSVSLNKLGGQAGPQKFGSYGWIQFVTGGIPGSLQRINFANSYFESDSTSADGLFYYLPPGVFASISLEDSNFSRTLVMDPSTGSVSYA
jgi:hypothetical protein